MTNEKYSDITLWKNITESEWTDWKWQLSHCISTLNDLSQVVSLSAEEYKGVEEATKALKMRISPHIALMMANGGRWRYFTKSVCTFIE